MKESHGTESNLCELAARHPAVAALLLDRFPDRKALRNYVLEVAALLPATSATPATIDEIADALTLNMGHAEPGQIRCNVMEWNSIFAQ